MAEINMAAPAKPGPGARRSKKLSTKVDLTPMVDLGFLLITFFIFNTKLSEAKEMKIYMPSDKDVKAPTQVGESGSLTVLPMGNGKLFYYHGMLDNALNAGGFGFTSYHVSTGIGKIIREKKLIMEKEKPGSAKDLTLMIKPAAEASYQNLVDLLDEVAINKVPHYAIMDITAPERQAALTRVQ